MDPSTIVTIVLAVCLAISEVLSFVPEKYIQGNSILGAIVNVIKILATYAKTQPAVLQNSESSQPVQNLPDLDK
jgi:hypothetical protein